VTNLNGHYLSLEIKLIKSEYLQSNFRLERNWIA